MMKKLLYILFLLIALNIYAVNQMNQMTFMSGEFAGSEYGNAMASIDFNGDGYQDLVVASQAWNPNHVYSMNQTYGKLYFYWGGPGFDNLPDFVIEGTYFGNMGNTGSGMSLFNAGDVNNDGIDDLVINNFSTTGNQQVAIYWGRENPQTTPDIVLPLLPDVEFLSISPLGDINGDNRDDLSLWEGGSNILSNIYIWTDTTMQPWLFRQTNNINWRTRFSGIGDVNGDSLADCYMFMPVNQTGQTHNRLSIYFGNLSFPQTDSLIICNDTNQITSQWGSPVGDFNGDGIDDFVVYNNHLWLGGSNLTAQWDVDLSAEYGFDYGFSETCTGYPFVHGDLNGDGFEDIISSNSIYGGHSGVLTVWMGRSQMNGTLDLLIPSPNDYPYRNFGYSKVTGDFNADGFCDIAVGAPWWSTQSQHNETGRVYVYAGNADLHDTTVANDDDVTQLIEQDWKLDVYPNPVKTDATIRFTTAKAGLVRLEVHNLKGQLVRELCNAPYNKGQHNIVWDGRDNQGSAVSSGVYLCRLEAGKEILQKKMILMK